MNMDQKELKRLLIDAYANALGKSIDTKTLNYLVLTITRGENTIQNIMSSLTSSPEYHEKVKGMFSIIYFDLIGQQPSQEDFEEFWQDIKSQTSIVDSNTIDTHVRHTFAFQEKYSQIIKDLFNQYYSREPTNVELEMYLDKLAITKNYEYDQLAGDIKNSQKQSVTPPNIQPSTSQEEQPQSSPKPTPVVTFVLDEECIEQFEKVFKRPMFVKEYYKYVVLPSHQEKQQIFSSLDTLYQQHSSMYNKMANISMAYLNTQLSEHEYVNTHLLKIDAPHYIDDYITAIVNSTGYIQNMMTNLTTYYKKIYDLTIDDEDLHYLFALVQKTKSPLRDEKVIDILKSFKQQTDDIVDNIFMVFQQVLERQPDMYEIEEQVVIYRNKIRDRSMDDLNSVLARSLTNTLEFHDIIKKHIKARFLQLKNQEVNPSKLYSLLQKLISSQDELTVENLDDTIDHLIDH